MSTMYRPSRKGIENLQAWMWQNSVYLDRFESSLAAGETLSARKVKDINQLRELRAYLTRTIEGYDWRVNPLVRGLDVPIYSPLHKLDAVLMDPKQAAESSLINRLVVCQFWGYRTGTDGLEFTDIAKRFKSASVKGDGPVRVTDDEVKDVYVAWLGGMLKLGFGGFLKYQGDDSAWRKSRWDLAKEFDQ